MGLSFTKRESKLQNEILIYKTGFLDYKWDSRVAIHLNCENLMANPLQIHYKMLQVQFVGNVQDNTSIGRFNEGVANSVDILIRDCDGHCDHICVIGGQAV